VARLEPASPPVERQLGPVTQVRDQVTPNLTAFWGCNPQLAAMILAKTGDPVPSRYATLGWMDEDGRALAVMISGEKGEAADLSFLSCGLPLSRPILRLIREIVFDCGCAACIRIHVRPDDAPAQRALSRLGFVCRRLSEDGRQVFILQPAAIPAAYRRARLRSLH
jgi:hypothetical protein